MADKKLKSYQTDEQTDGHYRFQFVLHVLPGLSPRGGAGIILSFHVGHGSLHVIIKLLLRGILLLHP